MRLRRFITCLLGATTLFMFSCSSDEVIDPETEDANEAEDIEVPEDTGDPGDDDLDTNSQNVSFDNSIFIAFSEGDAVIENSFADVSITNTNGHVVVSSSITDKELNYILSGVTDNGSIKIYGEYRFGLVLNGVEITNPAGAAINIQCGKKITVTVVDNTNNRLIDGETYTYTDGEDMKGTFFSEGQLNFYGNGTLEVRGKNKHAICTDDYFRVYEGNIWVKEAASDAIHANDYIAVEGGTITTRSDGDGLDCEDGYIEINGGNVEVVTLGQKGHGIKSALYTSVSTGGTIAVTTYGNGSKGFKCDTDMTISNGTFAINTAGDAFWDTDDNDITSAAGIKCDGNLQINNGSIAIVSTGAGGKGINVDGALTINNGTVSVSTTGNQYIYNKNNDTAAKGIKSDGDLTINGGSVTIRTYKTEAEGLESKATLTIAGGEVDIEAYDDCINAATHIQIDGGMVYCNSTVNDAIDSNGTLAISGGTIVAAGASSPEAGFDCDNGRFAITGGTIVSIGGDTSSPTTAACTQYCVVFRSSSSNTQIVRIESTTGGNEVLTFKLPKTYGQSMAMLFSSPLLEKSTGYTIYTGGSVSGGSNFHGLYTGATYSKGSSAGTFTTTSMVSSVGSSGNGPGGR